MTGPTEGPRQPGLPRRADDEAARGIQYPEMPAPSTHHPDIAYLFDELEEGIYAALLAGDWSHKPEQDPTIMTRVTPEGIREIGRVDGFSFLLTFHFPPGFPVSRISILWERNTPDLPGSEHSILSTLKDTFRPPTIHTDGSIYTQFDPDSKTPIYRINPGGARERDLAWSFPVEPDMEQMVKGLCKRPRAFAAKLEIIKEGPAGQAPSTPPALPARLPT